MVYEIPNVQVSNLFPKAENPELTIQEIRDVVNLA